MLRFDIALHTLQRSLAVKPKPVPLPAPPQPLSAVLIPFPLRKLAVRPQIGGLPETARRSAPG